ncbi:uncharacterized protein [Ptychodera flava]|uniref:uncharacterized protein n=1 Tax=Ptychodera flava TaxID=63121 RepID=UPI00396A188B
MFLDSSPNKCSGDLYILLDDLDLQNEQLVSNFPRSAMAIRCVDRNTLEEFLAGHTRLLRINDVPSRLQEKTWFSKRQQRQFVRFDFSDAVIQRALDETPVSCEILFPGLRRAFRFTTVLKVLGCPDGYYGLQCEDVCICKNGAACHVLNGACKCTPGWRGPACDIRHSEVRLGAEYREAYFGEYVLLSATGYNVELKNDNVKWYLNGSDEFLSGSKDITVSINNSSNTVKLTVFSVADNNAGVYLISVTDSEGNNLTDTTFLSFKGCHDNYFGANCDLACDCENGAQCDRYQGCVCQAGWTGIHCEQACLSGWYGNKCTSQCLCENNSTCNTVDGTCRCMAATCGLYCHIKCECDNSQDYICEENIEKCLCTSSLKEKDSPQDRENGTLTVKIIGGVAVVALISTCLSFVFFIRHRNGYRGFKAIVDTEFDDYIQGLLHDHPDLPDWNLRREKIKVIREIGYGEFGKIELATLERRNGPVTVAIKSLSPAQCLPISYRDFCHEITCLKRLNGHPNIINFLGIVLSGEPKYIVVEYAAHGDLLSYIQNLNSERITFQEENRLMRITRDTTLAMQYMEKERYIHRDLACRNILIMEDYVAKIGDFGLSRDIYETGQYCKDAWSQDQGPLPLKWMPVEFLTQGIFEKKSDVWSFGVLLWEIATLGMTPFSNVPTSMMVKFLLEGQRLRKPENCSKHLYDIMQKCWRSEPEERPSAEELTKEFERLLTSGKKFFVNVIPDDFEVLDL